MNKIVMMLGMGIAIGSVPVEGRQSYDPSGSVRLHYHQQNREKKEQWSHRKGIGDIPTDSTPDVILKSFSTSTEGLTLTSAFSPPIQKIIVCQQLIRTDEEKTPQTLEGILCYAHERLAETQKIKDHFSPYDTWWERFKLSFSSPYKNYCQDLKEFEIFVRAGKRKILFSTLPGSKEETTSVLKDFYTNVRTFSEGLLKKNEAILNPSVQKKQWSFSLPTLF